MKSKYILLPLLILSSALMNAQEKQEIVKTGLNFGPIPAVAFDADKGLQLGAVLQIFNYGDGHNYPNYDSKVYLEFSYFTKGSRLLQVKYDNKSLMPGIRWSSAVRIDMDTAYDFYGYNGYRSYYNYPMVQSGKAGTGFLFSPFYKMKRSAVMVKSEFIGDIDAVDHLKWEAGLMAYWFDCGAVDLDNINKGKTEEQAFPSTVKTLYEIYHDCGIISDSEFNGGFTGGLRLGMTYDSRDKEGAPSRGIWAETHITAAPGFLSKNPYYKYSLTWRHYVPIVRNDKLTLAYRLNYEGTFGHNAPSYALPFMTQMGEKPDLDGMGSYYTVRGIMRARIVGLDMAVYNAELRWRFARFSLLNQNLALGLSMFSDGAMVTRQRDISALDSDVNPEYRVKGSEKEYPHISFGAGLRFIMNENFILAFEYGTPLTHYLKNSPLYNQDGTGAFYINLGYLF